MLGKGKEGTTYLLTKRGKEYAVKTFKKTKSERKIQKEYDLQKKAVKYKICPKLYSLDLQGKTITMEKMDTHVYDLLRKVRKLTKKQQERILEIFRLLDTAGVFHNDPNLSNYMLKDGEIYIIDFGMAKEIDPKKLGTDTPNYKFGLLGFVLKIKELGLPLENFKYLVNAISDTDKINYGIKERS